MRGVPKQGSFGAAFGAECEAMGPTVVGCHIGEKPVTKRQEPVPTANQSREKERE